MIGKVSGGADSKSRYAKEYSLPSYDSTIEDYLEVLLLFGFVALFGLAFPVAATIVALNNTIELRADAYRIIMFHRRINAEDASSIGVWYHIINLVGFVSVLTNGALICFTSNAITTLFGSDDTQSNLLIQVSLGRTLAWLSVFTWASISDNFLILRLRFYRLSASSSLRTSCLASKGSLTILCLTYLGPSSVKKRDQNFSYGDTLALVSNVPTFTDLSTLMTLSTRRISVHFRLTLSLTSMIRIRIPHLKRTSKLREADKHSPRRAQ